MAGLAFDKGEARGVPPPKFFLLTGVSGSGKSLAAKYAQKVLNLPLYELKYSDLFGQFVGNSEQNMRKLLQLVELLAPCIVRFDEMDKGMSGTAEGAQNLDSGVSDHMHGMLLTWLQEHEQKVFMIGTCNDPSKLSSALVNRMDDKYFIGYLGEENLAKVWKEHVQRFCQKSNVTDAQFLEIARLNKTLVGREVE